MRQRAGGAGSRVGVLAKLICCLCLCLISVMLPQMPAGGDNFALAPKSIFSKRAESEADKRTRERQVIAAKMFFHGAVEAWNVSMLLQKAIVSFGGSHMASVFEKNQELGMKLYEIYKRILDYAHGQDGYGPFMQKLIQNNGEGMSTGDIQAFYDSFWGRYEQWKRDLADVLEECRRNGFEMSKDNAKMMQGAMSRLDKVLPFLLVRFPQGKLRTDERVEDVAAIFCNIRDTAAESHMPGRTIPNIHVQSQPMIGIENTDCFSVETVCDQFAIQIALERFISNAVRMSIKNVYVTIQ